MTAGEDQGKKEDKNRTIIGGRIEDLFGPDGFPRPAPMPGLHMPAPGGGGPAATDHGSATGPRGAPSGPESGGPGIGGPSPALFAWGPQNPSPGLPGGVQRQGDPGPPARPVSAGGFGAGGPFPGLFSGSVSGPFPGGPGLGEGAAGGGGPGIFPPYQPIPAAGAGLPPPSPSITLQDAMAARGYGPPALSNRLVAASADLLILFGRLRTGMVALEAIPLMHHVAREISAFEAAVLQDGIDPREAMIAKYLLCATADDIVQNLPGSDRDVWLKSSMSAQFFNDRNTGSGFFHEVDKLLAQPAAHVRLLELALICLSLGFEGRFRNDPNGPLALQRYRQGLYESLRRLEPQGDEDLSPRWQPIVLGQQHRMGGLPVLALTGVSAALLVGAYLGLRMLLSGESQEIADSLRSMVPTDQIAFVRSPTAEPVAPAPPESLPATPQLDRIRAALAADLGAARLEVARRGEFIAIRVNDAELFATGKPQVREEFRPLAARIAAVLDREPGPILLLGYTDSRPLSGTGRFKNNIELSLARARSVQAMLGGALSDRGRLSVEGRGEEDPIGDNDTAEGRNRNRRVEILIHREESLRNASLAAGQGG